MAHRMPRTKIGIVILKIMLLLIALTVGSGVLALLIDRICAENAAKKKYPDAEIICTDPNNFVIHADVAVLLYDKELQMAFQQNYQREWFSFSETDTAELNYDAAVRRRQTVQTALASAIPKDSAEWFVLYPMDRIDAVVFTAEQDENILAQWLTNIADTETPPQSVSIVSCEGAQFANAKKMQTEAYVRAAGKIDWFNGVKAIVPEVAAVPYYLQIHSPLAQFEFQSDSPANAFKSRADYIQKGLLKQYPDYDQNAPTELYYENQNGKIKYGLRQWVHAQSPHTVSFR